MRDASSEPMDLRPLAELASELGVEEVVLLRQWRRQKGAPRLYRLKRGLYLVSRSEVVAYLHTVVVPSADQRRARRSVIRRAAYQASRGT